MEKRQEEYDPLLRVSGVPDEYNIMYSADGRKVVGCRDCYLEEYTVREGCETIAKNAFCNGGGLRRITLPDSIRTIGSGAFGGCTRLQDLNIPDGVTYIGAGAFGSCIQLGRVVLPKSLKMLGAGCFGYSGVREVESRSPEFECWNGLVTHVPTATLVACVSTSKYCAVPEGIRRIGHKAFTGNRNVQTVMIPSTVERMAGNPFLDSGVRKCVSSSKRYSVEGDFVIEYESRRLVAWLGEDKEVEIPSNIRTIGIGAFQEKNMLEKVFLRRATASEKASWTKSVKDREVPAYPVEEKMEMPLKPFDGKVLLEENPLWTENASEKTSPISHWTADVDASFIDVEKIGDFAFAGCERLKEVFMPDTVKEIGASAFVGCKQLEKCRIPSGVTKIKASTFHMCNMLDPGEEPLLPPGVTSIGNWAFYSCYKLKDLEIPSGVKSIGESAFAWCTGLETLKIPSSVTRIGWGAFMICVKLRHALLPPSALNYRRIFRDCPKLEELEYDLD